MKPLTEEKLDQEKKDLMLKQALMNDLQGFTDPLVPESSNTDIHKAFNLAFRKSKVKKQLTHAAVVFALVCMVISVAVPAIAYKSWILQFIESLSGDAYYNPCVNNAFDFSGICVSEKIPENFLLSDCRWNSKKTSVHLAFTSEGGQYIQFIQNSDRDSAIVDTESADLVEKIMIQKTVGAHVLKNGVDILYWNNDIYYFKLVGNIPLETLLEIADSVKEQTKERKK